MKAYGQGLDDLDALHIGTQFCGTASTITLEAELHVFRGARFSIVKAQPLS